jgi:hypothetical protein
MKYTVEMGSGHMIYVHTNFHKNWFKYSEVERGRFTDTQT